MRGRRIRADAPGMETRTGRFRRHHPSGQTRRSLRGEILALRYELELLDEALRAASTSGSARAALDYAFTHLRAAEHAWQAICRPADLPLVLTQIDASRDALEAAVAARAGRHGAGAGAWSARTGTPGAAGA
jgi:hypothetical protein